MATIAFGLSGCGDGRRAGVATGVGGAQPGSGGAMAGGGNIAGGTTAVGTGLGGPTPWQWTVACPDGNEPASPIAYGRCALDQALAELAAKSGGAPASPSDITIGTASDPDTMAMLPAAVALVDARPESFVILPSPSGAGVTIVGRDDVGAMYGALELAERLRLHGPSAALQASTVRGAPGVAFRAANLFWTVKSADETDWWFYDESFWRQYLDLLAYARLDVLDVHAMYDPSTTVFPNALVNLAHSASFPDVGPPLAERDRNVAMFNKVVTMARVRGIRVGLMTYQASSTLDGSSQEPLDDEELKIYDREAAADVVARIPGLAMFGFRIGESGKSATWYIDSLVAGARQSNPSITLYTRTWLSKKNEVTQLANAIGANMVVEAKYNGEQLGPPYAIAGGYFGNNYAPSYSYEDYLTPPAPWSFVFQVRAAGTHRIFREVSYDRTRRAILSLGSLSPNIAGFSVEGTHAYAQQRDDYHALMADRLSPFTFLRDDLMYILWGRLGYDANTPESVFRALAAREAGADGLWDALQAASDIVPWIQTAHTCGPDHRSFEPEMELGGDVAQWAKITKNANNCVIPGTFDSFAIAEPSEAAADLVGGRATSRVSPIDVAAQVLADVDRVEAALGAAAVSEDSSLVLRDGVLARDIARESQALADLGRHFGHKLRAATALAVYAQTGAPEWLASARTETSVADEAWNRLADDTSYIKPFRERLRMAALGYDPFHWSQVAPADADVRALDGVEAMLDASAASTPVALPSPDAWLAMPRSPGPGLAALNVTPEVASAATWEVTVRFAAAIPSGADVQVNVLWKPFESQSDWSAAPATATDDGSFTSSVPGSGRGALFAVELRTPGGAWRYPDPWLTTPYVSVAP